MPSKIWNKYTKLKEINSNSNIKTYLARFEPIIKEITPKDNNEYYLLKEKINKIRFEIYEIIEENNKIFLVIPNNQQMIWKIDELILENENMLRTSENSLFEINNKVSPILVIPKINQNVPIIQDITFPIKDEGISTMQVTYTTNPQTTSNSNPNDTIPINQIPNPFTFQENPSPIPTPGIPTIPVMDTVIVQQGSTSDTALPVISIQDSPNLQQISKSEGIFQQKVSLIPDAGIQQASNRLIIDNHPNDVIQQIPDIDFYSNTPPQVVPYPETLSQVSTVVPPDTLYPPPPSSIPNNFYINSANKNVIAISPDSFSASSNRSIMDEDYQRGRPIYNQFNIFNDERYRGFRLFINNK